MNSTSHALSIAKRLTQIPRSNSAEPPSVLDWLSERPTLVISLAISFGVGIAASMIGLIVAVRMPPDALTREPRKGGWSLARNILGWILILAGILMLIFPGPGLIVLVLGATMANFPGRKRLQEWILSRKSVTNPLNRLRKRFSQPPLKTE